MEKACTELAHKRATMNILQTLRLLPLESVPLQVFTSRLRDPIFTFLKEKNFIEAEIQKSSTPKVSGVLEHACMMAHIINTARIKQRPAVITSRPVST